MLLWPTRPAVTYSPSCPATAPGNRQPLRYDGHEWKAKSVCVLRGQGGRNEVRSRLSLSLFQDDLMLSERCVGNLT